MRTWQIVYCVKKESPSQSGKQLFKNVTLQILSFNPVG